MSCCEVHGDDGAAGMIQALILSNSRLSAKDFVTFWQE